MYHFAPNFICYISELLQSPSGLFVHNWVIVQITDKRGWEFGVRIVCESCQCVLRKALQVAASQDTASQGAPSYKPIAIFLKQYLVLCFNVPRKHIVLILAAYGFVKVEVFAYCKGLKNLSSRPVACRPIESQPFLNDLIEATAYFLHGSVLIANVGIDNINVVKLQPLKAQGNCLFNVFAICSHLGVYVRIYTSQNFRADHYVRSTNVQLFQNLAQLLFRLSSTVNLGCVEIINSILQANTDQFLVFLIVLRL